MTHRLKALLTIGGVFLLGGLSGALALGLFFQKGVRDHQRLKRPDGFKEYFYERLDLNGEQKDSLREELEIAYSNIEELRAAINLEYREVLDSLESRMVPFLNRKQRSLFSEHRRRLLKEDSRTNDEANRSAALENEIEEQRVVAERDELSVEEKKTLDTTVDSIISPPSASNEKVEAPDPVNSYQESIVDTGSVESSPMTGDSILTQFSRRKDASTIVARLERRLDLTEEQTIEVRRIVEGAIRRIQTIKRKQSRRRMKVVAVRRTLGEVERQISYLLDETQKATFKEMKERRKKQRRRR